MNITSKVFGYCYYNVLTVVWILFGFNCCDNSRSSRRIYIPKNAPPGYIVLDLEPRYGESILDFGSNSAFLQNFFALDDRGTKIIVAETLTKLWAQHLITRFTCDLILKTSLVDRNFVVRVQKLEFRLITINDPNFQFADENSLILRTKANGRLSTIEMDFCVDYSTYNTLDIVQYGSKIVQNSKFYFLDVKSEFLTQNLIITAKNELENVATESIIRSTSNFSVSILNRTCDKLFLYISPNNIPGRTFFDVRNSKFYNLSTYEYLIYSIKSYQHFPFEIDPFTGQLFNIDHLEPNLHINFDIVIEKSCGGFSGNGHVIDFLTIQAEIFIFERGLGFSRNSANCFKRNNNRYKRDLKADILLNIPENYPIGVMLKDKIGLSKNERVKDAPLDKKMFTIFENGSILLKSQLNYELESAVQFVVLIHNSATMHLPEKEDPQILKIGLPQHN
uniref:Uncharacterized protein n=1 Tax=Romanomermis culicivorax TaxID=13658 RepID=A0A915JC74_ROMCU